MSVLVTPSSLLFEVDAIKADNEAIKLADDVNDFATRALLESILPDEDGHVDWIED